MSPSGLGKRNSRPRVGPIIVFYKTVGLYSSGWWLPRRTSQPNYPADVLSNDVVLPTPPCDPGSADAVRILPAPNGAVFHRCGVSGTTLYDNTGAIVYDDASAGTITQIGANDTALTQDYVIELANNSTVDITGLPSFPWVTRHDPNGGFWAVLADGDQYNLWHIAPNGVASQTGSYGLAPSTYTIAPISSKLDGCGNLFQQGRRQGPGGEPVILRGELNGPTTEVYASLPEHFVKMHTSWLVTGP